MLAFDPLDIITAKPLLIDKKNVDTDQILPAKFLTVTTKKGLGDLAFYGWRTDTSGDYLVDHFINNTAKESRQILLAGENFGCGSSREHAPWALADYGVKVILAHSLADIFKSNCVKNGIAAIELGSDDYDNLKRQSEQIFVVEMKSQTVSTGDVKIEFSLDAFAKHSLITGKDQLNMLIEATDDIRAFESQAGKA